MNRLYYFNQFNKLNEAHSVEEIPETSYSTKTVPALPYANDVKGGEKEKFLKKLVYICEEIGCKPEWMMLNIAHESGFDPHISNRISNATGLIQFMPKTIAGYKDPKTGKALTIADLKRMSAVQQLDIVLAYYKANMKALGMTKFNQPGDFFAITYYPAIVNKSDDWRFPANAIRDNKPFFNRIGGVTKRDYYNYCARWVKDPEAIRKSIKNFDAEGFLGTGTGAGVNDEGVSQMDPGMENLLKDVLVGAAADSIVGGK